MRTFFRVALVAVLLTAIVLLLAGAQEPRQMRGPVRMNWVTAQPSLGPNGEFIRFVIGAEYSVIEHKPSGDVEIERVGTIEFDLLKGDSVVFIGTQPYSYRLIARLVEHAAAQEYRKTFPTALPDDERTRLLRP